jgi:hypothetical protein
MNKDAKKQRKLLVLKLKERGVSVTKPLFEHGLRAERLSGALAWESKVGHRSVSTRAKESKKRGYNPHNASVQTRKVIVKHIPITLSIAELSKATGMFKGTGGTTWADSVNKVADEFAKTHKVEAMRTQTNLQYYYTKVGKGWTKRNKKPIDEQPS